MAKKLTVSVIDFHPVRRRSWVGFCNIHVDELGLTVFDVSVRQSADGSRWADLPGRPLLDSGGSARRTTEGQIEYVPLLVFDSPAIDEAFSAAVIAALLKFDPHALDEIAA